MAIYGVALLSACMFVGVWLGSTLGALLGLKSDVGSVGFAIVSTAIGAKLSEMKKAGFAGLLSLAIGIGGCFFVAACIAYAFDYRTALMWLPSRPGLGVACFFT